MRYIVKLCWWTHVHLTVIQYYTHTLNPHFPLLNVTISYDETKYASNSWCFLKKHHAFQTHWKRFWCWRDWGQEEKGTTEDEMAGWHHWLDGRESGWAPGVGDRQGGLACCDSWGCKELDMTEQLNWTELNCLNRFENLFCIVNFLFLIFIFLFGCAMS